MNISNILSVVYAKISASTSTEEVLILSKIAEKIKIGSVRLVTGYNDMLDGVDYSDGTLFFVEDEDNLYYCSGYERILVLSMTTVAFNFGNGSNGSLGDNSATAKSSPVAVFGSFTDWVGLSRGSYHTVGVKADGTAWSWGNNSSNQLGDNTAANRSSPVSVVGGFTDWASVASGNQHTLALRRNRTAWAWGGNGSGRLGDNTDLGKASPVSVVGGFTDWVQLSAGLSHSLGLRSDGTAWSWGYNSVGQLGDNTVAARSSPVSVVGGFTDWVTISGGRTHSVALRLNATIWAWGGNGFGQLGNGTTASTSSPVSIVGGFTDWTHVTAGNYHTVAIRNNGTAWAWGYNGFGQLGDNTIVSKLSPVSVVGGFTDWAQISAGRGHTAAIRSNGTAWAWGLNNYGQLGDNTTLNKSSPVSVVGGFADWVQLDSSTLALATAGLRIVR